MVFLELQREPGVYSWVPAGVAIKNFCLFSDGGRPSTYNGHLRNLNYAWQDNTDASGGEAGDQGSLSSWNSNIVIPIHF